VTLPAEIVTVKLPTEYVTIPGDIIYTQQPPEYVELPREVITMQATEVRTVTTVTEAMLPQFMAQTQFARSAMSSAY